MEFYIEDPKRRQNGAMCWWEMNDRGYVLGLGRARTFTVDEVDRKLSVQMGDKIAWPKIYIDSVQRAGLVWFEDCDIEKAWKPNDNDEVSL